MLACQETNVFWSVYPAPEHVVSQNVSMWFLPADLFAFSLQMEADEKHWDVSSQWKEHFPIFNLERRGCLWVEGYFVF